MENRIRDEWLIIRIVEAIIYKDAFVIYKLYVCSNFSDSEFSDKYYSDEFI
jgi:hypothetical protein